ncbi:MAG TPA: Ger(x)C family spore germination protein [Ureibacillus sp.]|nr:Ger(x)C family spore germination protein [Ureibacillus sp.]
MKKEKLFIVLLSCILLMGCADQKILERIGLVTLIGYDVEEEEKISATVVIRQINPEFQSKVEVQTETENTSKGTRISIDRKTAKQIAAGQLRVVLFGEDLAKKSIEHPIHTFMMNNEISTSIYLAVVRGDAQSLLAYPYENVTDVGQHIYNLIDHNIEQQQTISSTLHEIVRDDYSDVRNFALPILLKKGENIQLDGIALFKKGKMVGELPANDIFYIMIMTNKLDNGTVELTLDGETLNNNKFKDEQLQIAVDSIKTKRKIKVVNSKQNEFNLTVNMDCRLLEIDSKVSLTDPKVYEDIERAMSEKIKKEMMKTLKYSQEVDSDIYGFGEQFRSQVRDSNLTEEKWSELFQNMKVNFDVNVEIVRNGVFE